MAKVRLHNSEDWINLGKAKRLVRWKHRPGGASFGMLRTTYALYRTEQGNFVAVIPGRCLGIPYYMTVCASRYIRVTPEEAVELMCSTGARKKAQRLFPELAERWQPPAAAGVEV